MGEGALPFLEGKGVGKRKEGQEKDWEERREGHPWNVK